MAGAMSDEGRGLRAYGCVLGPISRLVAALGLILASCCLAAPVAAQEFEGTVRATHGDWKIVCKAGPQGDNCALVQSVVDDKADISLTVYVQRLPNGKRILRAFVPPGILLPPGLGLKVDAKDHGRVPYLKCLAFACFAQAVIEDKLFSELNAGKTAVFVVYKTEEAGIGVPISLNGFAAAMKAIEK